MTEPRPKVKNEDEEEYEYNNNNKTQNKKHSTTQLDFKFLESKYKKIDEIEAAKLNQLPVKPLLRKDDDSVQQRLKTYHVSSHGYHHWDPNTTPNQNDV